MPIDNPQATAFSDNYARQGGRSILLALMGYNDDDAEWTASDVQQFFTGMNLTETVQDQNVDGHPVTGQDVVNWALLVDALRTVLNDPANADKLASCQRLAVTRILG